MVTQQERYEDAINVSKENTPENIVKISTDELSGINDLQTKYSEIMIEFGTLKIEKMSIQQTWNSLLSREKELEAMYIALQAKEKEIAMSMTKKYGTGNLNLDTGEFKIN